MESQKNIQSIRAEEISKMRGVERLLRLAEVKDRTGLSRSTIYTYIQNGVFPKSVNLGARAVGWAESEINTWIAEKINADKTERKVS